MQKYPLETHIFKDCELYFEDKIRSFHDNFIKFFLLIGVDEENVPLDEIKMTKNPSYSGLYFSRIVGGIMKSEPLISIKNYFNKKIETNCVIYYLNNNEDIDNFYMLQKIYNWNGSKLICFQIWEMEPCNLIDISDHWL